VAGRDVPRNVAPLAADEEAAWRALARAVLVIPRMLDADLMRAQGLHATEYNVLMNLSEAPEQSLRMSELANCVGISVSGLTRAIQRLEREDRVRRVRSASDGRGQVAVLTPAGRQCLEDAWPAHLESVRRHVVDHLRDLDLATLTEALTAIAHHDTGSPNRGEDR